MSNLPDDWDGVSGDLQQMPTVGVCPWCGLGVVAGDAEYMTVDGKPYHLDCYWEALAAQDEEDDSDG